MIFWIALVTWLWLGSHTEMQEIVDKRPWIAFEVNWSWCNASRVIAAHNYKKLWKKIGNLQIGDTFSYKGCKYKIINFQIVERKTYDKRLLEQPKTLFLYTCVDDDMTIIFEAKSLGKVRRL